MLKTRIITASWLLIMVGWLILFASSKLFLGITTLVILGAALEWLHLLKIRNLTKLILLLSPFLISAFVLWFSQDSLYWFLYENLFLILQLFGFFWVIVLLLIIAYSLNSEKFTLICDSFPAVWQIFGIVSCWLILLSGWIAINYLQTNAKAYLIDMLLVVIGTDLGAYVFGKILGKHKLSAVSPKKTWEGILGGYLGSLGLGLFSAAIIMPLFNIKALIFNNINIKIIPIFFLLPCSLAILGDLFESLFKRIAKVKDSGKLLPGHGGILDRIDSLCAAMPIILFYYLILIGLNNFSRY